MRLVGHDHRRGRVLPQPICLSQNHGHTSIFDAEVTEQLFVLLFQFLPVRQHQHLSLGFPHHLGKQVALPRPARSYHQRTAIALQESGLRFLK